MGEQSSGRGRGLFVLAGCMSAVGIALLVLGIVVGVGKIAKAGAGLQQVVVPGTETLTLDDAGRYKIYHEHQATVGGKMYSNPQGLSGLACTVTAKATGQPVTLSSPTMSETYSFGSRQGISVWQFEIDAPGEYELTAAYDSGATTPQVVLAVGKPVLKSLGGKILVLIGGICGFVLLFGGAVAIFIVTLVKRGKAARRAAGQQALPPVPGTPA